VTVTYSSIRTEYRRQDEAKKKGKKKNRNLFNELDIFQEKKKSHIVFVWGHSETLFEDCPYQVSRF